MYNLRLGEPIKRGSGFVEDITAVALGWKRVKRRRGGDWRGTFTVTGDTQYLLHFFNNYMGCDLQETSGGMPTFRAMVFEMDLHLNGMIKRRSLGLTVNHCKTKYIDTDNNSQTSAAAENMSSQDRYGRIEDILLLDGFTQTAAELQRDSKIRNWAWPAPRPAGKSDSSGRLDVTVVGYAYTALWRYMAAGDGTLGNVSDFISEIVTTDCEFLNPGRILANPLQVRKGVSMPQRAWDVIETHVGLGGNTTGDPEPWRFFVDRNNFAFYHPIDPTPVYFYRNGGFYSSEASEDHINIFAMEPGVCRELSSPVQSAEYGGFFASADDFYLDEVEVSAETGLNFKSEIFLEDDILAAQEHYRLALAQEGASGGGGYKRENLNWKRRAGIVEGSDEWEIAKNATDELKEALITAAKATGKWRTRKGNKRG